MEASVIIKGTPEQRVGSRWGGVGQNTGKEFALWKRELLFSRSQKSRFLHISS